MRPVHEEDAVTVRSSALLAAALGAWLATPHPRVATAQEQAAEPAPFAAPSGQALPPRPEPSPNQRLADAVAERLRQSGQLRHYHVDVSVEGGTVELTGQVTDQAQRAEVLRLVQSVPGVARVRDRLVLPGARSVVRTQATTQVVLQEPGPLPGKGPEKIAPPPPNGGPLQEPGPLPDKGAEKIAPPPPAGGAPPEPTPIFRAPPGLANAATNPPPLPPYAWPTFAPYNNYSRVAYPTVLPPQAWPFIGPQYPFPKIPLGWRSVKLTYYNGAWWYGRRATGHDWWRIRYW
jgi:hypothetical protein